jgi:hypothetical protein
VNRRISALIHPDNSYSFLKRVVHQSNQLKIESRATDSTAGNKFDFSSMRKSVPEAKASFAGPEPLWA